MVLSCALHNEHRGTKDKLDFQSEWSILNALKSKLMHLSPKNLSGQWALVTRASTESTMLNQRDRDPTVQGKSHSGHELIT